MSRIICIDWGAKRCGIAATDLLRMIASPLTTVEMNMSLYAVV